MRRRQSKSIQWRGGGFGGPGGPLSEKQTNLKSDQKENQRELWPWDYGTHRSKDMKIKLEQHTIIL